MTPAGGLLGAPPGRLAIPGLVVAHTHLYLALARGLATPGGRPGAARERFGALARRLARALDLDALRIAARAAVADAVRAGATCLVDLHRSPAAIAGSLDVIADELQAAGLRGVLAYASSAREGGEEAWRAGLAENERFLRDNRRPLVRGLVGLEACAAVPDEAIAAAAELARRHGVGLHLHVAEDDEDRDAFVRLERAGALVPRSVFAGCVRLSPGELRRAAEAGIWVAQTPRSNMHEALGYARLGAAEGQVALGTDGRDGDVLAEARALQARAAEAGDAVDPLARLEAGRRLARDVFGGADAGDDLAILLYDPPTPLDERNLGAHLLEGAPRVEEVRVAGVRPWSRYDTVEARAVASAVWERMTR